MPEPKKQLRPTIPSIQSKEQVSVEEKFQNETLRPIIKLQHELILSCFKHYLAANKIQLEVQSEDKKRDFIQKCLMKNAQLKSDLRSLIIGLFTIEEYTEYLKNSSQINKRINSIIQSRITSVYVK